MKMTREMCPRCFGRGYKPEYRAGRPGFYARTCPRCRGAGSFELDTPEGQRAARQRNREERLEDGEKL